MPTPLALALLLAPLAAPPVADFHDRVTQGRLAEAAATGAPYQKALWGKIGDPMTDAMKACIKRLPHPDKSPFTLVADVGADGRPAGIDVQPRTPLADCLTAAFAGWTLPAPPKAPAPYPIEIDVSVVP